MSHQRKSKTRTVSGASFGLLSGEQQKLRASSASGSKPRKRKKKKSTNTNNANGKVNRPTTAVTATTKIPINDVSMDSTSRVVPPSQRLLYNSRRSQRYPISPSLPTAREEQSRIATTREEANADKSQVKLFHKQRNRSRILQGGYIGVQQNTGIGAVLNRKQNRGLNAVISAHRAYDKQSMEEAARKSALQASKRALKDPSSSQFGPKRPPGNSNDSGSKHRNFLQRSTVSHLGGDIVESAVGKEQGGQNNISGRVLTAKARSIQTYTDNSAPETDEKQEQQNQKEQQLLLDEAKKKEEAEFEAAQFLAAIAAEEEEQRRLKLAQDEERRLELLAKQEKAAAAAAAALLEQKEREAKKEREDALIAKHLAIQSKYELLTSPLRPKTSLEEHEETKLEKETKALPRSVSREGAGDNYFVLDPFDTTPIVLPFHLDPIAKAVAAEIQAKLDYEAKLREAAEKEAEAKKKAAESFLDGKDDVVAPVNKSISPAKTDKANNNYKTATVAKNEQLNNIAKEDKSNELPIKEEQSSDAPLLRVFRRARPHIAGIRPMISPHDAAISLSFSVAMFHRDPNIRRSRWNGSLPLPPDSETCCRRGMTLLQENNIQESIFWFSIGYGQEADTYADGSQQMPSDDGNKEQDPYFVAQEVPDSIVNVVTPQTGFEHGVLSILARGIAYTKLGCWSQALWDFREADSMAQEKCKEALYFCAQAHEARNDPKKSLEIINDLLETEPRGNKIVIGNDIGDTSGGGSGKKKNTTTYDDVFYSHVLTLKAVCLADLGRYVHALEAYDLAIERDSANTTALWSRTRLFLDPEVTLSDDVDHVGDELTRKRAALKDLTKLVSIDPGKVEYLEDAVDMFVDLAQYQEGLSVVQVLIEVWTAGNKKSANADAFASSNLPSHGFEQEIFLNFFPNRQSESVGNRQLAMAYCLRGRLRSFLHFETCHSMASIMEDFEKAEELDPKLPHVYLYRAALMHPAKLLTSARINNLYDVKVSKENVEQDKKSSKYRSKSQDEEDEMTSFDITAHRIIQDLSMCIDLLPSSVDAYILRASMYIRVGMFTPALHDLRNSALLKQDNIDVWLLIARIYLQHFHDYDSAINAATFAIRIDSCQNAAYYVRAEAHLRGGDIDMALNDYTRILRNDPTEPWPWLFQGHILAARGRARLAIYSSIAFLKATGEKTSKEIAETVRAKAAAAEAKKVKTSFRKLWKNDADVSKKKESNTIKTTKLDITNDLLKAFDRAASQYRNAAMRNPSVHTFCRLADALVHLGDVTEALRVLNIALEMDDESPEVHATLGRLYLSIEDYDRALDSFNISIELDPSDSLLYNERGVCKTLQEQTHLAHIRDLELQRARTGGFEPLKRDFVQNGLSSDEDDWVEELDDTEFYNDESSGNGGSKGGRGRSRRRGKKEKSKSNSPSSRSRSKSRIKNKKIGGSRKRKKRRRNTSRKRRLRERKRLSRRLEKHKREPYVPKTREQLELVVGMSGLRDINKCLKLNQTNTDALLNRAELYVRAGANMFATEDFESVLELDPKNVRCYINRGVLQIHRSRPAEAIEDFDHALAHDPSNPLAFFNRAVAYTDAKQYDQAIEDYTNTLFVEPDAVEALRNRGLLFLLSGNSEKAKQDLSRVLELVQDSPEESESHDLLPSLGQCQMQLGLLVPEALNSVNRAMNHRGCVLVDALVSRGSVFFNLARAGYEFAPSSTYQSMEQYHLKTHSEIISTSSVERLESEKGHQLLNARSKSHYQWIEKSISDFSKALRLDPGSTIIRTNLAEALSASAESLQRIENINSKGEIERESIKKFEERKRERIKLSLKHFTAVLVTDPNHVTALNGRGIVQLRLGRFEEAYNDLTAALVKIEEGTKQKRTLKEVIAIRKAMNAAIKVGMGGSDSGSGSGSGSGSRSSTKISGNSDTLLSKTIAKLNEYKTNNIEKRLQKRKGLDAAKKSVGCLIVRAMVSIRAGSAKHAESDLVTAINLGEEHGFLTPLALHDLGTLKLRAGNYVSALELLNRAIKIPGSHVPLARMSRGIALCAISPPSLKEALDDFNASVQVQPSNVHGLYNRAVCHATLGNLQEAENDLMRAIAIAPSDGMLYDQRGKTLAAMGRTKKALKDFATSLFL
jgi:tetratricopeptide (TPR) repeat protein